MLDVAHAASPKSLLGTDRRDLTWAKPAKAALEIVPAIVIQKD